MRTERSTEYYATIVAKYFKNHFASATEELAFEKKLADKTMRTNAKTEGARA